MKLNRLDFEVADAVSKIRVQCFMAKCRLGLYVTPTHADLARYIEQCERSNDERSLHDADHSNI